MKCILHIGVHKTGTTAIQTALAAYDDGKNFYAQLGYVNHSTPVCTAFKEDFLNYHIWVKRGLSEAAIAAKKNEFLKTLDRQLSVPSRETVIISGEDIGSLRPKELVPLIDFIGKRCDKITVLAYVRRPLDFAASSFQERVRGGLATIPERISGRYENKLERFCNAVGEDNVMVRVYDRDSLVEGDIVKDFCHSFGLDFARTRQSHANESLSAKAIKCLYCLNRTNPLIQGDFMLLRARIEFISILQRIFENDDKIDIGLFAGMADDKDAAWLKQQFGIDFAAAPPPCGAEGDLSAWLDDFPPDIVESLYDFLKINGVDARFENDPVKLINRIYYLTVEGKILSPQGLKLRPRILNRKQERQFYELAMKLRSGQNLLKL